MSEQPSFTRPRQLFASLILLGGMAAIFYLSACDADGTLPIPTAITQPMDLPQPQSMPTIPAPTTHAEVVLQPVSTPTPILSAGNENANSEIESGFYTEAEIAKYNRIVELYANMHVTYWHSMDSLYKASSDNTNLPEPAINQQIALSAEVDPEQGRRMISIIEAVTGTNLGPRLIFGLVEKECLCAVIFNAGVLELDPDFRSTDRGSEVIATTHELAHSIDHYSRQQVDGVAPTQRGIFPFDTLLQLEHQKAEVFSNLPQSAWEMYAQVYAPILKYNLNPATNPLINMGDEIVGYLTNPQNSELNEYSQLPVVQELITSLNQNQADGIDATDSIHVSNVLISHLDTVNAELPPGLQQIYSKHFTRMLLELWPSLVGYALGDEGEPVSSNDELVLSIERYINAARSQFPEPDGTTGEIYITELRTALLNQP